MLNRLKQVILLLHHSYRFEQRTQECGLSFYSWLFQIPICPHPSFQTTFSFLFCFCFFVLCALSFKAVESAKCWRWLLLRRTRPCGLLWHFSKVCWSFCLMHKNVCVCTFFVVVFFGALFCYFLCRSVLITGKWKLDWGMRIFRQPFETMTVLRTGMLVKALISSVFRFVSGISGILKYATSLMSWSACLSMSLHWDDPVWLMGCSNSLIGC